MTKIEELEQKLNECQKALAELKESKKEGKWKPKKGEDYWFRDSFGNNIGEISTDCRIDRWRSKHMVIFPTKEECARYWHFMDTVKEKSYSFSKEEWEDVNIRKYYIFYSYNNTYFKVHSDLHCKDLGTNYFKTEEDAQYIIDNFKDELMEYWI